VVGDAGAAPVRIAGTVFGGREAVTVRLAIDVPDPGIWTGRDAAVGADGAFDFGPMRPGRYLLVASGTDLRSRVTPLDTSSAPGDRAELYMYPCQSVTGRFAKSAVAGRIDASSVPAAGIALEIAGQVIGTTDADGSFDVCVLSRAELRLAAAGYESSGDAARSVETSGPYQQDLASDYVYTGTVVDGDGSPVRDIGVQPVWGDGDYCMDSSVVVTTDAAGRFRFGGRETICGIRVLRGTTVYEAPYVAFQPTEPAVIAPLPPPPALALPYPTQPPLPPALEVPAIVPLSLDGGPAELTVQLANPVRKRRVGFGLDRARPLGDPGVCAAAGTVAARDRRGAPGRGPRRRSLRGPPPSID
jgi:hypothetical protein